MKYKKGEKVNVITGKYAGENVHIIDIHINFNPILYSCRVISNGKEIAVYENEIQSMYKHDMEQLCVKLSCLL